jgi:hypothetical protein
VVVDGTTAFTGGNLLREYLLWQTAAISFTRLSAFVNDSAVALPKVGNTLFSMAKKAGLDHLSIIFQQLVGMFARHLGRIPQKPVVCLGSMLSELFVA